MKVSQDYTRKLDSIEKHNSSFGNFCTRKGGSSPKKRFSFLPLVNGRGLTLKPPLPPFPVRTPLNTGPTPLKFKFHAFVLIGASKKKVAFVTLNCPTNHQGMLWNGMENGTNGRRILLWNMEDAQNGMEWKI